MTGLQDVRTEVASVVEGLGCDVYDYLPGAAQLPGIVVDLPGRLDTSITTGYWEIELPVYVITRSADPLAGETALLDLLVLVVAALKAARTGITYSTLRVIDVDSLYQIAVGTIEAHSARINLSLMIPSPN